jgi:uncharacterized membrane protein YhaH (DUF805 family)
VRRFRIINVFSAAIAASTAVLTIAGLYATSSLPESLAAILLQIIVVTAALAVLIGLLNLLSVHLRRMQDRERGAVYSLFTIVSAIAVIVIHVLDVRTTDGGEKSVSGVLFETIQVSLESALGGLLFFFLVYAVYRMMRDSVTWQGLIFTVAVLLILIGWLPLSGLTFFENLRDWLLEVPVTAGARGVLIGIALGTVVVGTRVLIGQERAYREE